MKRVLLVALVVVGVIILAGGVWTGVGYAAGRGSGNVVSEDREVSGFTRVDLSGVGNLIITQGDHEGLRIEAEDNILTKLSTEVEDGVLRIGPKMPWRAFGRLWPRKDINLYLSVRELKEIHTSGSTRIQSDGALEAGALLVSTSGSSRVNLQARTQRLEARMSGSGNVTLSGIADSLRLKSSGSARFYARGLQAREVTVESSGSANVEVFATATLRVDMSGSGKVAYAGSPVVDFDASGSGKIVRLAE